MLNEKDRKQLDTIVGQMVANKETDDSINFVVNDFKQKYAVTENPAPKKSLLQKTTDIVTSIFPGKKIGESIGTAVAAGGRLLKGDKQGAKDIMDTQPTVPQLLGEGANIALDLASFGGVGLAGKFTTRLAKSIGIGAGMGASSAIADGDDIGEIERAAIGGGAVGAALPVAGAGFRAIGRAIDKLPTRVVNSALGRSKQQIRADILSGKKDDLAQWLLQNKKISTADTLYNESVNEIKTLGGKIKAGFASSVTKNQKPVTIGTGNFLDAIAQKPTASGAELGREGVKNVVLKLAPQTKQLLSKPSLTVEEANKLRDLVDTSLGDRAFLNTQNAFDKKIALDFANSLRELVKSKAPPGVRALFEEQAKEITLRNALTEQAAKKGGAAIITTSDIIGGGLGTILGGMLGNPLLGAAAGVGVRKGVQSTPFLMGTGKLVNALSKAEPVLEQLTPAQQTVILKLFTEMFGTQ